MRRNAIVLSLLAALVAVGLVASLYRGRDDGATITDAAATEDVGCDLACVEQRAVAIAVSRGGEAAARYVESIDDPTVRYSCHAVYHAVGRALGAVGWPSYMTDTCQYGYLHGVLQGRATRAAATGEDLEGIVAFCGRFDGLLRNECLHGTGHAVAILVPNNLEDAVRTCAAFDAAIADTCASGVLMEYAEDYADGLTDDAFLGTEERLTSVPDDTDFHALCPSLPITVRRQCYLMIWIFLYPTHLGAIGEADDVCPTSNDAVMYEACHTGFSRYALLAAEQIEDVVQPISTSTEARRLARTVVHLCAATDAEPVCIEQAARSLYLEAALLALPEEITPPLCEEASTVGRSACERGRSTARDEAVALAVG